MRILVADDVEVMRISLDLPLRAAGHEVVTVSTGRAAFSALQEGHFDAAVLDLWMPDGDGMSVLRQIRDRLPALRVIIITGGGPKMPIEGAALISQVWGAERVLIKPFDETELVAALATPPKGVPA